MTRACRLTAALLVGALLASPANSGGTTGDEVGTKGFPSPLRLLPADVDLVVTVPDPRRLAETATGLEVLGKLEQFSAYRELLNSTRFRHFRQFLAYYEKEMGAKWPQLLAEVAGGGLAVGLKVGKDPQPALLVIQGRDRKRVAQFARLAVQLLEQELARQDEKVTVTRANVLGVETVRVGDKFFAAVAGSTILVSNQEAMLQAGFDLCLGGGDKSFADNPQLADAAALLPPGALATLWFNLETARKQPQAAAAFKPAPRDDPALTILFGGYLDVIGRSPFVAAALVRERDDLYVTVRMPKGRNGMGPDSLVHVPPANPAESLPLLEPKGVLFSTSFYLDVARIWEDRNKLFTEKVAKEFDSADKKTNPVLSGLRISKILPTVGRHHRFVVASQGTSTYSPSGGPPIPAFALVSELRDPEYFAKTMETTLRGAALLAGFRFKLKLVEEKVGPINLVGYRFSDQQTELGENEQKLLRYYSPCFARVGDRFLVSSTMELGRELVGILQAEKKGGSANAVRSRIFGAGAADLLQTVEDEVVTQFVLDGALPVERATAEVKAAFALLRSIGPLDVDVRYDEDRFSYNVRLKNVK
jgi:hypothetical protein